jgi:hypothetical protein
MVRKWSMVTRAYILLKTKQVVLRLGTEWQECPLSGQYRSVSSFRAPRAAVSPR